MTVGRKKLEGKDKTARLLEGKGCVVVDAPGYGFGSVLQWGVEVEKYLRRRKQLKRVFILVVATLGLQNSDKQILSLLREANVPHQVVLTKVDKLLNHKMIDGLGLESLTPAQESRLEQRIHDIQAEMRGEHFTPLPDILCTSAKTVSTEVREGRFGIANVRLACMQAAGMSTTLSTKDQLDFLDGIEILDDR